MDEKALTVPRSTFLELEHLLLPEGLEPNDSISLIIQIEASDIVARELAGYLNLIDNIHGRFYPTGLYEYSQRPAQQVRISSIRAGSTELEIISQLADSHGVRLLILVFLILKYLPDVLERGASAYRQYEEGRLARERRHQLRTQLKEDSQLGSLPSERRNQLVTIIDETLLRARRFLPKAWRLSKKNVKAVRLIPTSREDGK